MKQSLTEQQAMRYARQILLPEMDLDGQEALLNGHILVIGLGGLGCAASQYLAGSGVGKMTLVDHDKVELTNLPRQLLHQIDDIGLDKVKSAKTSLQQINPDLSITTLAVKLNDNELLQLLTDVDLVLDCTDNLASRRQINRACVTTKTPLVSAAAIRFEGQITTLPMDDNSPCYQCFSAMMTEQQLSCVEAGVLSPVVGIMGTMQALEAIKLLTNIGKTLAGSILFFDAKTSGFQSIGLRKQPDCPVCAQDVHK